MNRSNTLALFMGCCLLGHAKAQSPMHLVIDTTTTQILPLVCGAAMSDGGDALLLQSQTGLVVLRCDPMGAPQWRNKYATGVTYSDRQTMITASNGDLLLALVAEPQISNDTVHMYGELKRISSAGTPLWSRSYDHSQPMSSGSSGGFLVKLSEDLDGNIFMLHGGATFGVNDRYLITMLDQGGTLLWSKRFGLGTADPVLPHGPGSRLDLTPDNLGGCYLTFGSSENIDIWMARLDGNGDLDWSKSVTFSGSSTNTIQSGAIADATGHYTVALSSYLAIGPQQLRIRFDQAGQLQYVDGYDLNTATVYQELDHSSGSQVVTGSHTFVLDSVGTPISVSVPVIRSSGDTTFTHVGVAMDVHDGMIHLYGAYRWFHNIWGTIGYNPDVIRIPLQGPLGCAADTFNVLRTPFPNNLFQNAPFVWGAPFDASPLVASGPASFIPQGLLTTAEICGTGTGISDHHDQGPVFRIIGNPMTSGAPLEISCDRPVRISIYNATGSLVHETRLGPGVSAVPLKQLSPGIYMVAGSTVEGTRIGVLRLVVH